MKFKTKVSSKIVFPGTVTCVTWNNNEEVYTISDDHQLYKWTVQTQEPIPTAKMPDDFFPTDLHCLSSRSSSGKHNTGPAGSSLSVGASSTGGSDVLLITSTDGRFVILNKSSRVERNVAAHSGAISTGRWSPDGAGLFTAGEDGMLKVWSRTGMLRSTVVQNDAPIRCACWSSSSDAVAYTQGEFVTIKPLAAKSKLSKWRAHDSLVLCLSWSSADHQYLVTGCEDCKYKLWTAQGTLLFVSTVEDFPITSVDFSPKGDLLAVGSFNALRLCNYNGWSHGNTKFTSPKVGSLFSICWSSDCTQVAMGTSTGAILFGYVVEQTAISRNLIATTAGRKTIKLLDISNKASDTLDFPNRIIHWRLGYDHLVVATDNQVHIYNQKYINTPLAVIDGRNGVHEIMLGKKLLMIVDNQGLYVYTYSGRLHLNPKYGGILGQIPFFSERTVSLGLHFVAIRDAADKNLIRLFELVPGASRQSDATTIESKSIIDRIAASRAGHADHQFVVFIDANRDLFCSTSLSTGSAIDIYKIGTQVSACLWGTDSNILVGLHDSSYTIWYCPGESCTDPTILTLTKLNFDTADFGRNVSLDDFEGATVTFGSNGVSYPIQVNFYFEVVHRMLADDKWVQALKVCRLSQNIHLWATLAAIASRRNQLDICEEAYSCALQVDKVDYLKHIKNLAETPGAAQNAESAIMSGRLSEAETILQHSREPAQAIATLVRLHTWDRALELALQHQTDVEWVLGERRKYLHALQKDEYLPAFLKANDEH